MNEHEGRLTTEELAWALCKGDQTIRKWAREGTIPFVRQDGQYWFDLDAVNEALEVTTLPLTGTKTMDTQQLAAELKRQPSTIQRWARQGYVPSTREGRKYRFDPAAVRAALVAKPWLMRGRSDIGHRTSLLAGRIILPSYSRSSWYRRRRYSSAHILHLVVGPQPAVAVGIDVGPEAVPGAHRLPQERQRTVIFCVVRPIPGR